MIRPKISLVVALSSNRVIGIANRLPWKIPEDLQRFKAITLGGPIIMGRKTFDSIGRVLPGRHNIVITRKAALWGVSAIPGATVVGSLHEALHAAMDAARAAGTPVPEVFVIGGAEIFRETMALADRLYLTEIDEVIEGDTYFPEFNRSEFREMKREDRSSHVPPFRFLILDRFIPRASASPL